MSALLSENQQNARGHRPRLQGSIQFTILKYEEGVGARKLRCGRTGPFDKFAATR